MLGFATAALSFLLKIGFGGIVDKTLGYMKRKAELQNDAERIRAEVTIEHIKAAVQETRIMAELEKQKLGNPMFWIFLAVFILPFGAWWTAVILDTIFLFPNWSVGELPPQLAPWAGRIIAWLFFTGGTLTAIRMTR
ncbi:MAG: hypothetical protein KDJ68_13275 [Rhodobiaceae bacterium]|nr:hypothetical protein [Rhodobiaceae bacterium]